MITKQKLTYLALLIVGLCLANIILHQMVLPQDATELALRQMQEDGSREQMRIQEYLSNWITPILVVKGLIVAVIILRHKPRQPHQHAAVTADLNTA